MPSIADQISKLGPRPPKQDPKPGGTNIDITGYDDNGIPQFKLPGQRSNTMPAAIYGQLMQQASDKGYWNGNIWPDTTHASPEDVAANTQKAIQAAQAFTSSAPQQQKQAQVVAAKQEEDRPKGRMATLMNGPSGLLGAPNTSRRSLLAF